jgi:DNA-directed RNA polymerase specialized sigma24 family protein
MANTPLTPENFERLLLCLNSNREKAGEEYLLLWQKMREYFAARGSNHPEELADETVSRLARKIAEGEEVRNIFKYSYGLARLIWMESLRKPENSQVSLENATVLPFVLKDFLMMKEENACYLHCLGQLTKKEKELIVEYWELEKDDKHHDARKHQAEKMGISRTALRIRVLRIKKKLKDCLVNCWKNKPPKTK